MCIRDRSDIDKNACKVIYDKDGIHGVFSVFDGTEPTYKHIAVSYTHLAARREV